MYLSSSSSSSSSPVTTTTAPIRKDNKKRQIPKLKIPKTKKPIEDEGDDDNNNNNDNNENNNGQKPNDLDGVDVVNDPPTPAPTQSTPRHVNSWTNPLNKGEIATWNETTSEGYLFTDDVTFLIITSSSQHAVVGRAIQLWGRFIKRIAVFSDVADDNLGTNMRLTRTCE